MPKTCFHPSLEGAQHGAKTLTQFLDYAKAAGATGAQPSNFMLEKGKGFKSAEEIQDAFALRGMSLDGISAHCPFWVHTTAWTSSPTVRPFLPPELAQQSAAAIEQWSEDYLLRLMDLAAELKVKIMPMFWGVAFGWELATGYPWGFWKGGEFDLVKEGIILVLVVSVFEADRRKQLRADVLRGQRHSALLGSRFTTGKRKRTLRKSRRRPSRPVF